MPLHFANAWMLYGLWLVPVGGLIWLALWRRQNRALAQWLAPTMRAKLCPPPATQRFYWQWAGLLSGCLLALLAAARPQWGVREETVIQRGRDLIIALDVSRSMLAEDVHPNRLQRAQTDIQDLLRELRGDRAALLAFRGRAIQLCPLTTDYAYLEEILNDVTVDSAPRGQTDIGAAIHKALDAFESDQGAHRAIVLISDGEDLAGKARAAAAEAQQRGVVIFTVGLGDPQGATIPSALNKNEVVIYQGQPVVSKLEHATLKALAEITGGVYIPVGVANVKLGTLYRDHLSKIAAQDIEESLQRRYVDRFQWFLLPALLCLLASAGLSRGRLARSVNSAASLQRLARRQLLLALIGLAGACNVMALTQAAPSNTPPASQPVAPAAATKPAIVPGGRAGARLAQSLYRKGKYEEAAATYLEAAASGSTGLRNSLIYNAAGALYRAGQYQAAADHFLALARQENALAAAASYNAGCALFQLADQEPQAGDSHYAIRPRLLEQAGEAFQRAWRRNPELLSARANLASVTQALPAARSEAHTRPLLEKYGQTQPGAIAAEMLDAQRQIVAALPAAMTNATPARINMLEALAEQQRRNTTLLIPLRAQLATAGAQQLAQMQAHLEALENEMQRAREDLRNLDNQAYAAAARAKAGIYNVWKAWAPFPLLLREDLQRQTNAITMLPSMRAAGAQEAIRAEQEEATLLTQLFAERFAEAVPPEGLPPPPEASGPTLINAADTTPPPAQAGISAEKRATILDLAREAQRHQEGAAELLRSPLSSAPEVVLKEQQEAYRLLQAIADLLPQEQQEQPAPDQEATPEQEPAPEQPPTESAEEQSENQPPPAESEPAAPEASSPPPEAAPDSPPAEDSMTPAEARALLEKAVQRERERREERQPTPYIPPAPLEKDW
ncbi:MAG: VWA domain-containing protein [Lentisphaerae bacterium]|nr:VWA domain-containing protein [Lentisphaerota bacterium]